MIVNHSSIPTFATESSTINQLRNGTILFCDNYNGERKNFIVVDENSLRTNFPSTVETAFTNGWIEEFGKGGGTGVNYYRWDINTDDINTFQNICLYKDFLKDRSKFKVFIGGNPFDDWGFYDRREYRDGAENFYTQHLDFSNGYPASQPLIIIYREDIEQEASDYTMMLYRSDSNAVRNRNIHMTVTDSSSNHYYLSGASLDYENYTATLTYTDFSDGNHTNTFTNYYPDILYCEQFPINANIAPKYIEIHGRYRRATKQDPKWDKREKGFPILLRMLNTNSFDLKSEKPFRTGEFIFRIFDSSTNTYSKWMTTKYRGRKLSVYTTDATLSIRDYKGFVFKPTIEYT